jgi:acyl-CoA thioesterase
MNDAVTRMLRDDAASTALGIAVSDVGPGTATARLTVRPDMVNGHGIAHGAFVFAVADTAFACACNSHGPTTVAAAADITFVAPAYVGDVRSGIYDISVRRGGTVVAEMRGTSRRIDRDPS